MEHTPECNDHNHNAVRPRNVDCICPEVRVGGRPTGSHNWNPDCPAHPWDDRLQAQSDRAVEWQRRAAEARRSRG